MEEGTLNQGGKLISSNSIKIKKSWISEAALEIPDLDYL